MKTLVIDAGNTNLKLALIENGDLLKFVSAGYEYVDGIEIPNYDKGIIVSVVNEITSFLKERFPRTVVLEPWKLNIKSKYSLKAVGADRIAACYPFIKRNKDAILVIYGTSITINAVKSGVFLGGPILPPKGTVEMSYNILSMKGNELMEDTVRALELGVSYLYGGGLRTSVENIKRIYGIRDVFFTGVHKSFKGWKRIDLAVIWGAYDILIDYEKLHPTKSFTGL